MKSPAAFRKGAQLRSPIAARTSARFLCQTFDVVALIKQFFFTRDGCWRQAEAGLKQALGWKNVRGAMNIAEAIEHYADMLIVGSQALERLVIRELAQDEQCEILSLLGEVVACAEKLKRLESNAA